MAADTLRRRNLTVAMQGVSERPQPRGGRLFARRALRDFGLTGAFEARSHREQDECLEWIEAAVGRA
jgi:hypothetical protein